MQPMHYSGRGGGFDVSSLLAAGKGRGRGGRGAHIAPAATEAPMQTVQTKAPPSYADLIRASEAPQKTQGVYPAQPVQSKPIMAAGRGYVRVVTSEDRRWDEEEARRRAEEEQRHRAREAQRYQQQPMQRRRPNHHAVEAALKEIIDTESRNAQVYVDTGLVTNLLCKRFDVTDLTQIGVQNPFWLKPMQMLAQRNAQVNVLINAYKKVQSMGSLYDCLQYVNRQMRHLTKDSDSPVAPTRFEDIGVGPFHLHPEVASHFPGVKNLEVGEAPPRVTMSDMFDGVVDVLGWGATRSPSRGREDLTPQSIIEKVERKHGGSMEELCIFATSHKLGLMVKILSETRRGFENEYRAFVAETARKMKDEYRAGKLAQGNVEALNAIDAQLAELAVSADDLIEHLHNKVYRMLTETNLPHSEVESRMHVYAGKFFEARLVGGSRGPTFFMAFLKAMSHYLTEAAKYGSLDSYQCAKCNVFFDTCAKCFKRTLPAAQPGQCPVTRRREPGEGHDVMEDDEIWESLGRVSALTARDGQDGVLGWLAGLEVDVCGMLGVEEFESLGQGGFLGFLARQMEAKRNDADDAVAAAVEEVLTVRGARAEADAPDSLPPLADVLDAALDYLESKKPFVTSWKVLNNIEEEVPKRFGKDHWSGICAHPFVLFMMRNVQEFNRRGYDFFRKQSAEKDLALTPVARATVAAFLTILGAVGDADEVDDADAIVDRQFGVQRVELFGYGTATAVVNEVAPDQKADLAAVWCFPELDRAVARGAEAGEAADVSADPAFESDPLQALLRAAQEPNGVDLASVLLWEDLYEAKHGSLEAFINANAATLREEKVKVLASREARGLPRNGMLKFYAVATAADVASIEAAADRKAYYEMAFHLWSFLVANAGGATLDGRTQELLGDVLLEAFKTARLYNLPGAVCEVLLAIPVELVAQAFGEWVAPALAKVDAGWQARCAGVVAKHSHKAALLRRGLRLGITEWAMAAPKFYSDCPVFGSAGAVVSGASVEQRVGKVTAGAVKGTQTDDVDFEQAAAAPAVNEDGGEDVWGDRTAPELYLASVQKSLHIEGGNNISDILKRTLNVIAEQLYESKFHFFFELIQNADDNLYYRDTCPSLYVLLSHDHIEILNNEEGFAEANVKAVCNVNLSTKSNKSASIGRKGIGFKAVFSVTDRPHIVSNGFNFFFDRTSSDIGLIYPHKGGPVQPSVGRLVTLRDISPEQDALEDGEWVTRLALPFKKEVIAGDGAPQFLQDCSRELADVQSLVLLFLNKLRRIHVVNLGSERVLSRTDRPEDPEDVLKEVTIAEAIGQESREETTYLVYVDDVSVPEDVLAQAPSKDASTTRVQIGFAKCSQASELPRYPVMAYLPTNTKLFSFILQADWTVNAARDRIVESDHWNKFLRESSAGLVVHGLMTLPALVDKGELPTDYVFAMLPGEECRDNWFRPLFRQIFKEMRDERCVVTADGSWRYPHECIYLPEHLKEALTELFPAADLSRLLSRYYVHDTVSQHRGVLKHLLVKELKAAELVELVEGLARAGELAEKPIDWLGKFFAALREVMKNVQGAQEEALVARIAKLPLIPVAGGARLPPAGNEILLTTQGAAQQQHVFFRRLNVVDKDVLKSYELGQGAAIRNLLLKLGVRHSDRDHILTSARDALVTGWRDKLASGSTDPTDYASLVLWANESFKKVRDHATLRDVLYEVPVMCPQVPPEVIAELSNTDSGDDASLPQAVAAQLPTKRTVIAALPHAVHVFDTAESLRREYLAGRLAWLVLDRELYGKVQLQPHILAGLAVQQGVVGGPCPAPRTIKAGDAFLDALKARGLGLPPAADGKYVVKRDCEWKALQRVVLNLKEQAATMNLQQKAGAYWNLLAEVCYTLFDQSGGVEEGFTAEITYLPVYEGTVQEGKVAREGDREVRKVPSSIANFLASQPWVLGTDGGLHAPCELFHDAPETRRYLKGHVAYVEPLPNGHFNMRTAESSPRVASFLKRLGLKGIAQNGAGELSDTALAAELAKWHQREHFRASPEHMTDVLKKVGGTLFTQIWMPQSRDWLPKGASSFEAMMRLRGEEVDGMWYNPAECFVKGGKEAFLDRARSPYRYVGFVYLKCGYDLAGAGVKEHSPWEVQVEAMESIAQQNLQKGIELIEDHIRDNFCRYQGDINDAGWAALRSKKIWFTTSLEFTAADTATIVYNDVALPVDETKLPKTHRVLKLKGMQYVGPDELTAYIDFLAACGVERLSEVFKEDKETVEGEYAPMVAACHEFAWRSLFSAAQRVCQDMLDDEEVSSIASKDTFTSTTPLTCRFVEKYSVAYTLNGAVVSQVAHRAEQTQANYEAATNTIYLSTGGSYSAQAVVETVLRQVLELVGQASNDMLMKRLKDSCVTEELAVLCTAAAGGACPVERVLRGMEEHAGRQADGLAPLGTPWVAPKPPSEYRLDVVNYGARLYTFTMVPGGDVPEFVGACGEGGADKLHAYAWVGVVCAAEVLRHLAAQLQMDVEGLPLPPGAAVSCVVVAERIKLRVEDTHRQQVLLHEERLSHCCRAANELLAACPRQPAELGDLVAAMVREGAQKLLLWDADDDQQAAATPYIDGVCRDIEAAAQETVRSQLAQDAADIEYDASVLVQKVTGTRLEARLPEAFEAAFEKAKPKAPKQATPAEQKPKREVMICDPAGRGTRWGGQTTHGDGHKPKAGDPAAARKAMERAEEAKANWPSYQIPAEQDFFETKEFLGPKDGFDFRTGKEGVGYYREGAAAPGSDAARDGAAAPESDASSDSDSDSDEEVGRSRPPTTQPGAPAAPVDGVVSGAGPAVVTVAANPLESVRDIAAVRVPQSVLEGFEKAGSYTYLRVGGGGREGDLQLGRWGEECMFHQLRRLEAERRETDPSYALREIHWLNEQEETKFPFDIVLGVPLAAFKDAVAAKGKASFYATLQRIAERYPRFNAVEVKTSLHDKPYLEVGLSEFNAARAMRDRFAIYQVRHMVGEPTYKVFYDPYGMTERHELKLVLAVAPRPPPTDDAGEGEAAIPDEPVQT